MLKNFKKNLQFYHPLSLHDLSPIVLVEQHDPVFLAQAPGRQDQANQYIEDGLHFFSVISNNQMPAWIIKRCSPPTQELSELILKLFKVTTSQK